MTATLDPKTEHKSVFERYAPKAYPHNFRATIHLERIAGGIPTDPKVAEGWIRSKIGETADDAIRAEVSRAMIERAAQFTEEITPAQKVQMEKEILAEVNANRHLNGFKRDENGLYIEGRQVKAAIKEAANVRWPKDRWGPSRKGTMSFFAEHVFVQEDRIPLGVTAPSEVAQRFVHTWRGSGIQYEEVVHDVTVSFTVATDHDFSAEQWAMLWLTGEKQGLGATRSQGYGRYTVIGWDKL